MRLVPENPFARKDPSRGRSLRSFLRFALAGSAFLSCTSSPTSTDNPGSYQYQVPEQTADGWSTASLADVGLDKQRFVRLMKDLQELEGHQIHSILVAREGKLVFEEYFDGPKFSLAQPTGDFGFNRDDTHNLASVTKSITTTLVGIAIDQGLIPSVEARVFDFFPEQEELVAQDPRRGEMTVEHLLFMESGIQWNDLGTFGYDDPRNDLIQMFNSSDPIGYALSRDLHSAPGTIFEYCNANTNILGEIVRRVSGVRLDQFSRSHLFDPLGVEDLEWQMMPNQVVFASGDLRLRPRDMAKVGQLFLRMGHWEGEDVVSEEWVGTATSRHVNLDPRFYVGDGYGYGWWHWDLYSGGKVHRTYQASGWGGQWIVVIPEYDMVVVSTGGNYYQAEPMPIQKILTEYIFPAVD